MCAVMIAMSGLAQNLEQFIYFICDCCLLGFLPLVLSFFINPIGVSDQAWGTIVTFTVRVLVPEP